MSDVSRETSERLERFQDLIRKWNPRINLVSKSTLSELRTRHIADSLQLFDFAPTFEHWVDLGSGGGFPGLVVAIQTARDPIRKVTLVESDKRKATFLRQACRQLDLNAEIIPERVESLAPLQADVLSARALADLDILLGYAERHMKPGGVALFPKGKRWKEEVEAARERWKFDLEAVTSRTERAAAILKISGVSRA